jgi:hypothetical protein
MALSRPEYGDSVLQLRYRYRYQGESYVGRDYQHDYVSSDEHVEALALASRYPSGSDTSCWVNPDEPSQAYLLRSDLWQGLWIFLPLIFVAAGAGGLWLLHRPKLEPGAAGEPSSGPAATRTLDTRGFMLVFFGLFLLFGVGFLVPFFIRPALQVLEARSWQETQCEILSSELRSHAGDDSTTYSIEVFFSYQTDGREYRSNRYQFMGGSSSGHEGKAEIVAALPPGATTVCYFDPERPFEAVIERGFTADYLFGLVPLVFVLIGLGGLFFAVHAMRHAKRKAAEPSWSPGTESDWSRSVSRSLSRPSHTTATGQVTLEPGASPLAKLGCAVLIALGWNGFVSIFVWQVYQQWRAGHAEWFATIVVTPFALIGLLLLLSIPYSILALLNPKPWVRLSAGEIRAGDSAQLEWGFRGFGGRIRRLRIWLEASTTETTTRGSSTRVVTKPLDTPHVGIIEREYGLTEQGMTSFDVPGDTPPSSAGNPAIQWKLKLHGDIAYWPDVNEEFPVRILPAEPH